MKKSVIIAISAFLAVLLITCVVIVVVKNNGGAPDDTTAPTDTTALAPTLVGTWALPESEWFTHGSPEYWEINEDGKLKYYQTNANGIVLNTIDGSWTVEGETLHVTLAGFTVDYTYKLTDANTMLRSDHGTDVTLTRYTGKIVK